MKANSLIFLFPLKATASWAYIQEIKLQFWSVIGNAHSESSSKSIRRTVPNASPLEVYRMNKTQKHFTNCIERKQIGTLHDVFYCNMYFPQVSDIPIHSTIPIIAHGQFWPTRFTSAIWSVMPLSRSSSHIRCNKHKHCTWGVKTASYTWVYMAIISISQWTMKFPSCRLHIYIWQGVCVKPKSCNKCLFEHSMWTWV